MRSDPAVEPTATASGSPSAFRRRIAWATDRQLHVVVAALIVLVVGLQQNFSHISSTRFHPDESRWLNRSHYTVDLLNPFSAVWEDRYLTRGQPPGGSYITGVGLLLQGHDLNTNGPWDFRYGGEALVWWNASRGNMPSIDDLMAARRTSALLGTLSALALFAIVTRMSNVFGGLIAGLFLAIHPLNIYLSTLGVSDAAFTFLVALSTLAAMALAVKPTWGRTAFLGLLLGAGAATKLSPLFIAAGLAAIGGALVVAPFIRQIPRAGRWYDAIPGLQSPRASRLGWMLLCLPVITLATFIATYPYLWPAPLWRIRTLFEFRRDEMENQARIWPDASIDTRFQALERTWHMLQHRFSASGNVAADVAGWFGQSPPTRGFDVPLAVAGLLILTVLTIRQGIVSPTFLGAAVAGGQALLILGGLRVDFDRYYLPIVFIFAIGVGILGGSLWSLAAKLVPAGSPAAGQQPRPATSVRQRPTVRQHSAD